MRTSHFEVTIDGVEAYLTEAEAQIFIDISLDLRAIMETPALGEDPVRERLFPRAYLDPTEETAEIAWAAFAHPELLESRVATLVMMVDSIKRMEEPPAEKNASGLKMALLSPQETESWLKGVNDLRLALGTKLEISEEEVEVDPVDPMAQLRYIYEWLTDLQSELLEQVYLS